MITTRTAQHTEYQLLADLGRRAFYEAFHRYNDPADMQTYLDLAFNHDTVRKALEDPAITFIIAFWGEEAVGYAKLKRGEPPKELTGHKSIMLERIYALQAYVGKKIGKALMQHVLKIATGEGAEFIWLGVWQKNETAIAFYRKWGFEVIGTKQFVLGKEVNDDYLMALRIPKPD